MANIDTGTARKAIFDRIKRNQKRRGDHPVTPRNLLDLDNAKQRLQQHPRNLQPAIAQKTGAEAVAQFTEKANLLESEVIPVQAADELPALISDWLKRKQLPQRVNLSDDLADIDWASAEVTVDDGPLSPNTLATVTTCRAGLAETGGLVMASASHHGAGQNFVPDNHFVLLRRSQIVSGWEDAFDLMRDKDGKTSMPRAMSFIAGPSRTADIEFTVELGAHGPRHLVIFLLEDQAANS